MISVFTPSHRPDYLNDCYNSLRQQTLEDWEWVVVLNGDVDWTPPNDERVKLFHTPKMRGVGEAKKYACEQATGSILVELDHDDWLLPHALEEIAKAFEEHPDAALVYSDFSYMNEDGSPSTMMYQGRWNYSMESFYGHNYLRCHSQMAIPDNVGVIWYAPNHVRAFSRNAYEKVGGYDESYTILDDQDLMTRLFLIGDFVHIDKMLYLQRMHEKNTQFEPDINAEIQRKTVEIYKERIGPMTEAYVDRLIARRQSND